MDPKLWKLENYTQFLTVRRQLLADAANAFLDQLLHGPRPSSESADEDILNRGQAAIPGGVEDAEEERVLTECNAWVVEQGLPEGEFMYELVEPTSGNVLAFLDLAWPNGLQEGYSQPAALLLDEPQETLEVANRAGFLCFSSLNEFMDYVRRDILALHSSGVLIDQSIAQVSEAGP